MKTSPTCLAIVLLSTGSNAFTHTPNLRAQTTLHALPTQSNFLTPELATSCIATASGTPLYAYSLPALSDAASKCLAFPNAYGLTVRYAMKACPNGSILKYFKSRGIHIDASSGFEVRRALDAGFEPGMISLSSQELPEDFGEFVKMGVKINAW
jgi:diaminopimelate decarboxylase